MSNLFSLGKASSANVKQLKIDMQRVIWRAIKITKIDFSVVECRRSTEQQRINITKGVSWSMDSRHLVDPNGDDDKVFAADIYPYYEGRTNHDEWLYRKIAKAMFQAASELNIDIRWGGFWKQADNPHWQLSWESYPLKMVV